MKSETVLQYIFIQKGYIVFCKGGFVEKVE